MALGPICGKVVLLERQVIANNGATRVGQRPVDGPGAIGSAAVQLLKSLGVCVTAVCVTEHVELPADFTSPVCRTGRTRSYGPAVGADGRPRLARLMRRRNLRMIVMRGAPAAGPMVANR
jgi:hypothetical protein